MTSNAIDRPQGGIWDSVPRLRAVSEKCTKASVDVLREFIGRAVRISQECDTSAELSEWYSALYRSSSEDARDERRFLENSVILLCSKDDSSKNYAEIEDEGGWYLDENPLSREDLEDELDMGTHIGSEDLRWHQWETLDMESAIREAHVTERGLMRKVQYDSFTLQKDKKHGREDISSMGEPTSKKQKLEDTTAWTKQVSSISETPPNNNGPPGPSSGPGTGTSIDLNLGTCVKCGDKHSLFEGGKASDRDYCSICDYSTNTRTCQICDESIPAGERGKIETSLCSMCLEEKDEDPQKRCELCRTPLRAYEVRKSKPHALCHECYELVDGDLEQATENARLDYESFEMADLDDEFVF